MNLALASLSSGVGMMLVALAAVWYWRRVAGVSARWYWIGAGLWTVAVLVKVLIALVSNPVVIGFLKSRLPHALFVAAGGLYLGVESSVCEIGLTLLAGLRWRQLGRDARRAIAVGVGAGAFEALLLGIAATAGVVAWLAGAPGTEGVGGELQKAAATPLFWLLGPVERVTAIICHASSRGLVLLGVRYGKGAMIALGFLIFTMLDGVAGAVILSGLIGVISSWWFELAFSVFALVSLPLLRGMFLRWGDVVADEEDEVEGAPGSDPDAGDGGG
jgi:hypothetical protein